MGKRNQRHHGKKHGSKKNGSDIVHVEVETLQHIEDLIIEQTTQIIDELMSILRETIQQQNQAMEEENHRDTEHYRRHQARQENPGLLQTRSTSRQEAGIRRRNNEQGNVRLNIEREGAPTPELNIDAPQMSLNQGTQLPPGVNPLDFSRRSMMDRNRPLPRNQSLNMRANVQTTMQPSGRREAPVAPVQIATPQTMASSMPSSFRQVSYEGRPPPAPRRDMRVRQRPATGLGTVATAA
jgi:hypothetical protein